VTVIALTGGFREFWLPLGDVQVRPGHGDLKPVTALENLKSGPTSPVAYGGMRLWIDPIHDPVLIFRCLG
jgi:starch synthase (maltosyl-transferring)